jgi:mono/diheme cytochrome c family protein
MHYRVMMIVCIFWVVEGVLSFGAAEQHMMQPRVPADKLAEARSLTSPLPDSPETVEKGKALYEGKATCMSCHGQGGAGDGPLAASLNPAPRNFHHHGFWRHRTEGELFWVIKYGIPGTAMMGFDGQLTDEEIWAIIQYEHSFSDGHGHHEGMGPRHESGRAGPPGCCAGQEPKR